MIEGYLQEGFMHEGFLQEGKLSRTLAIRLILRNGEVRDSLEQQPKRTYKESGNVSIIIL